MQLHVRDCGLRSAFFSVAFTKYVDLCICYIYFEQALQRIVDACLFQSTKRSEASRSISAGSLKQTSTNAYHISVDSERRFRGAMWESLRERVLFPVAGKPSAGSSLLPTRRNKILRESNFAEKSKFSPSNSFCAVPTDSNGTPRDASTQEREGVSRNRRYVKVAHLEDRPVDIAGRDSALRASLVVSRGLRLKIRV